MMGIFSFCNANILNRFLSENENNNSLVDVTIFNDSLLRWAEMKISLQECFSRAGINSILHLCNLAFH